MQIFGLQTMSHNSVDFRPRASVAVTMNSPFKTAPRMTALTTSQIGKVGETFVASQLMLASGGRLSPFLPLADDAGVDLVLLDKVTAAALTIQIKSRTDVDNKKAQTVEFNVRRATFTIQADAYMLGILLDAAGQGIRSAWLVPNAELEDVSNRRPDKLVLTPSAKSTSNDRYTPYRCRTLVEVCERLLAAIDSRA